MNPLATFELILSLLTAALILPMIAARLPLPPAASLVLGGMLLAAIPGTHPVELSPDLVMVLFLPPLLMASAFVTVWRDFKAEIRPILSLALGAVIFTTFLVGYAVKHVLPALPWGACFALGAIVSPPDAVAAKAVIHGLPLPRRVVTILEGESLVNDASGLLLYRLAVAAALTGTFSLGAAVVSFVWLGVGGVALGLGVGNAVAWIYKRRKAPHEVVMISFLAAWVTYVAADHLGASGVLAVVACGLVIGWHQHDIVTAQGRAESRAVWLFTINIFESLIFVLIGLSLRGVLTRLGGLQPAFATAGPVTLIVVATVIAARLSWVFPAMYLPRWLSLARRAREPAPSMGIGLVAGWAGMRGVVSLAAALALPLNFPGRDILMFATFGVIAVTVLFQGSTLGLLIRRFVKAPATAEPSIFLTEHATRAAMAVASLKAVEALVDAERSVYTHLIEEYRHRVHVTGSLRDGAVEFGEHRRREYFDAVLRAIAAGRMHLLELHRAGRIHDSVLHPLEMELDLEELRIRQIAGER